jgi:hypothetical protein
LTIELLAYGSSFFLPQDFYYAPPARKQFLNYLEHAKDTANLSFGWLPSKKKLTSGGQRKAPDAINLTKSCVSLYGDSFTFGADVPDDLAWGNLLISSIGCRVDNYGVSGFGTDQAYLRFAATHSDEAPVVILAYFPENIIRNVNQNRSLIYGGNVAIKPLFTIATNGSLEYVPRVPLSEDDYEEFVTDPGKFLTHEYLLPDSGPLSQRTLEFPYSISFFRVITYRRLFSSLLSLWFDVAPWYMELYDPNHPADALMLTAAILATFDHEAKARGKHPLIVALPSIREFDYYRENGLWIFQPLIDELQRSGIRMINLGPLLTAHFVESDYCYYVCTRPTRRSGHYTAEGNRVLAKVVGKLLLDEELIDITAK